MLPVDEAAVEARHVFAQRLEFCALALVPLRLDAVDRFAREELQRDAVHAAHIGQHVDDAVERSLAYERDEPQRSPPGSGIQGGARHALMAWSSRVIPSIGSSIR